MHVTYEDKCGTDATITPFNYGEHAVKVLENFAYTYSTDAAT